MKDYIVTNKESDSLYSKYYLSKGRNKKEAIDKVFEVHGDGHAKKDFAAATIEEYYKNDDAGVEGLASIFG